MLHELDLRLFGQPPSAVICQGLARGLARELDLPAGGSQPEYPAWVLSGADREAVVSQLEPHLGEPVPFNHPLVVLPRENLQNPGQLDYLLCVLDPLHQKLIASFPLTPQENGTPAPSVHIAGLETEAQTRPARLTPRQWLGLHLFRLIAGSGTRPDALSAS